jgi:hypothetical protein
MPPRARRTNARPASAPRRPTAITSLQDKTAPVYRNWMVYAPSGTGKTVFAGTASDALFLTADPEGTESARMLGSTADELRVNSWENFLEYNDWICRGSGHKEYGTIILDTADELEELCWLSQLVNDELKRASKYQPNKGDYPVVWRKLREEMMRLVRAPVNVIFLAHMMHLDRENEEGDTITLAMPEMGSRKRGELSSYMCGQMGLVGYMRKVQSEDGGIERHLMTEATDRYVAKDRTTTFGAGIVDPTVPGMLAAIEAKRSGAGSTTTARRRTRRAR